jgi:hypothetical protein
MTGAMRQDIQKTLQERRQDIEFLMRYAVPAEQAAAAAAILEKYAGDIIALNILYSFYIHLPEGMDDSVLDLRLVNSTQGVFLLCVSTGNRMHYLYLVNNEAAHIIGTVAEGIVAQELLDFFGYRDNLEFMTRTGKIESLPEYKPYTPDSNLCPSCQAAEGEFHTLGCPVEICPWCKGQLTYCNCRFTKLDVESLDRVSQVEKLQELLEAAGRIPFHRMQNPAYPTLDDEER